MSGTTLHFTIGGMSCAGCSGAVERVAKKQAGVIEATVNLALETADITFANTNPDLNPIIAAIEKAGFTAALQQDENPAAKTLDTHAKHNGLLVVISALLATPFLIHMLLMLQSGVPLLSPWIQLALATPVQFLIGWRFHVGAIQAIKRLAANMDVLVSLGTNVAFGYSLWQILLSPTETTHLYFEASAMIITMVLFGKWLEDRAKKSASEAIHALMALRPDEACVRRNGKDEIIPVQDIRIRDTVVIKPGERIPVDGIISSGTTELDESLVTGESLPCAKSVGDTVVAGAVNGQGLILITAQKIGADTTLGKIIALVSAAQTGKAPIQRLVDKVAAIFVPVVVTIAILTFIIWLMFDASLDHVIAASVSVLVIACPCALGLATPAALVAGTGAAAKAGILIRDIETLERASSIDTVIFDKTGTLTEGHPKLVNIQHQGDKDSFLRLIAAAQQGSEHPLAHGILDHVGLNDLPPISEFSAIGGAGLIARVEDHTVLIGTPKLLQDHGIKTEVLEGTAKAWEFEGQTTSFVAIDHELVGLLGFSDTIRSESPLAIQSLKNSGISAWLLSGDTSLAVEKIAHELGIEHHESRATPEGKAHKISELQNHHHVAMVGDGINDAPALAQADVSIAMGSGTDVAMATAGITLMHPDPRLVDATLQIAKQTHNIIRQNLFWAFAYNVIGIPLAALGILHPAFAGGAMALSSVSVVSNALRLKSWKPKFSDESS